MFKIKKNPEKNNIHKNTRVIILVFIWLLCLISILAVVLKHDMAENGLEQDIKKIYSVENVSDVASIENLNISNGKIVFQIHNLTKDNSLCAAYLEYVRLENGEEKGIVNLDCDVLDISPNQISEKITFEPHKYLGKEGIIRFRRIIFNDAKDNYNRKSK